MTLFIRLDDSTHHGGVHELPCSFPPFEKKKNSYAAELHAAFVSSSRRCAIHSVAGTSVDSRAFLSDFETDESRSQWLPFRVVRLACSLVTSSCGTWIVSIDKLNRGKETSASVRLASLINRSMYVQSRRKVS